MLSGLVFWIASSVRNTHLEKIRTFGTESKALDMEMCAGLTGALVVLFFVAFLKKRRGTPQQIRYIGLKRDK